MSNKYNTFVFVTNQKWNCTKTKDILSLQTHYDAIHDMLIGIIKLRKPITTACAVERFATPGLFMVPILADTQYLDYKEQFIQQNGDNSKEAELYSNWFLPNVLVQSQK